MKFFLVGLLAISTANMSAQEGESSADVEMCADRPGASTGTGVMGQFQFQWETGFGFENNKYNGADEKTYTINTSLFRLGLTDVAELRLQVDEQYVKSGSNDGIGGLCPLVVGTKVKLFNGYKAVPQVAMLCNLTIPSGKDEFKSEHLAPSLYLLFDNQLCDKWSLGYNVGGEWDGESSHATTFVALCLGYSICDKLSAFVENYDYFHSECKPVWMTEFGFAWQVAKRVQLDVAGDLNLRDPGKQYAVSCGLAWLIN